jgi:ribosomal protein L7Ae-like RNA K-turn-binding protein
VETELDFSSQGLDAGDAVLIANDISGMRALSSANLLGNQIPVEQAHELVAIMQSNKKLTTLCGFSREESTLDVSNQGLGPGDAVLIANDISDMRAMTSLNLASNKLGVEGAKAIAACLPKCT